MSTCRPTEVSYSKYIKFKNFCHTRGYYVTTILNKLLEYYIDNSDSIEIKSMDRDRRKIRLSYVDESIYRKFAYECKKNNIDIYLVIENLFNLFRNEPKILNLENDFYQKKERKSYTKKIKNGKTILSFDFKERINKFKLLLPIFILEQDMPHWSDGKDYNIFLSAVYLLIKNGKVIYVGETSNLHKRIVQHNNKREFDDFCWLPIENTYERKILEQIYQYIYLDEKNIRFNYLTIIPVFSNTNKT